MCTACANDTSIKNNVLMNKFSKKKKWSIRIEQKKATQKKMTQNKTKKKLNENEKFNEKKIGSKDAKKARNDETRTHCCRCAVLCVESNKFLQSS